MQSIVDKAKEALGNKKAEIPVHSYCHSHDLQQLLVFRGGEASLWAGAARKIVQAVERRVFTPALVINLSGVSHDFSPEFPVTGNGPAKELLGCDLFDGDSALEVAVLEIEWDDGGTPRGLSASWWQQLARALQKIDGDIAVCCVGGHGRTGTALSVLTHHMGLVGEDYDPVEWVRTHYCDSAVETLSQITYIERMTGRQVEAKPSDPGVDGYRHWWRDQGAHSSNGSKDTTPYADGVYRTISRSHDEHGDMLRGI